ncbi:MAG: 4-hydroxy-tetrahydrodipicolinate synthase [Candidatus Xenobia bacterium]
MTPFGNIMTAMVTPFNEDLSINEPMVGELAHRLVEEGSDGLIVCGTTGESPTLSHEEKLRMFRLVKEAVGGRASVWAGTGGYDTASTIELSKEAEQLGVDGLLVVAPYYNKPPQEGLYQHFKMVAEAVSLPIMVYNIPGRTGVNILPETLERMAEIKNIAAVKEAAGSVDQVADIARRIGASGGALAPARARVSSGFMGSGSQGTTVEVRDMVDEVAPTRPFYIYSGDDSLTLPFMTAGALGVVSVASHVVGPQMKKMVNAFLDGRVREAARIHVSLFPVFKALFATTNPILVKAAMQLRGMDVGGLRPPMVGATSVERDKLKRALQEAGIL